MGKTDQRLGILLQKMGKIVMGFLVKRKEMKMGGKKNKTILKQVS